MDSLFIANLTSPPLLFFLLGMTATLLRTGLEIPESVGKLLSIYLLLAIGFKGGVALSQSTFDLQVAIGLGTAFFMSLFVPFYVFLLLRKKTGAADVAAIAATYGSISAVTFIACTSYLDTNGIDWSGYMVAAMAIMEAPAIVIGLLMYRLLKTNASTANFDARSLFREAFLNSSVFLILGSLAIGWITGLEGNRQMSTFVDHLFVGLLCLFLLDMGMLAMRRLMQTKSGANSLPLGQLIRWALLIPLVNAATALAIVTILQLPEGDALLLVVLSASASYIAVPAAMRLALPEANPSIYLAMSLAITFPFNLLVGIPIYHQAIRFLS